MKAPLAVLCWLTLLLRASNAQDGNCRCGWKNPSRIVGGTETGVNEFPMMCALVAFPNRLPSCGCTIISNKYVLTAATCVYGRMITVFGVFVGDHDYTKLSDTNATCLYGVQKRIVHPNYNVGNQLNDIAIVQVEREIQFSDRVGPVCLPFKHSSDTFEGDRVTALGWGALEFGGAHSTTLQQVQMSVLTNSQCKKNYPLVTDDQFCTFEEGKGPCVADQGGPILWEDPISHNLVLAGVISDDNCGLDPRSNVDARVGAYMDWIVESTPGVNYCTIE